MADPRISEDLIIDIGRRVGVIEDARDAANDDLKQTWSDAREQFRAAGLSGAEVSKEVALLKGAVAETRLADTDKTKRSEKADGIDSYLAILTSPRARARARRDKSEPLLPPAAQEVVAEDLGSRAYSSGRTESSEDGQPIRAGSHIAADHGDAGPDGADKMGSTEAGSVASEPETNSPGTASERPVVGLPEAAQMGPQAATREGELARTSPAINSPETANQSEAQPVEQSGQRRVDDGGRVEDRSLPVDATAPLSAAAAETGKPVGERDGSPAAPARAKTPDEIADGMGLPRSVDPRCQKPHICGRSSHLGLCADCRGESAVAA